MALEILRIGNRYINTAHIAYVEETGGNVVVTMTTIDSIHSQDNPIRYEGEYMVFKDREADALRMWLMTHSFDVLCMHTDIADFMNEGVEPPYGLND